MTRHRLFDAVRVRAPAALAAALTVGAGLGARALLPDVAGKVAGDALYAMLIHALVLVARPRTRPTRACAVALGICFALELAQLTPVPAWLSSQHVLLRLVFGTTFGVLDLASYVLGGALALGAHTGARRLASRSKFTGATPAAAGGDGRR